MGRYLFTTKDHAKKLTHQIIPALYITAIKFNGLLPQILLRFIPTMSKCVDEYKIGHGARSFDALDHERSYIGQR